MSLDVALRMMIHIFLDGNLYNMMLKYFVQFIFLFTGVFSTCAAQYVFYQGAGDQKAMILPLCNYLGMMLVGLVPTSPVTKSESSSSVQEGEERGGEKDAFLQQQTGEDTEDPWDKEKEKYSSTLILSTTELTRRQAADTPESEVGSIQEESVEVTITPSTVSFSASTVQLCIIVSIFLDFAGCIFSNLGLSMAGSGLYQVVYSSVICWSALLSRLILKKIVSRNEWIGIALVTFGLAYSALGESGGGRNSYMVLTGCFNTLIGAAFYGGNYVTGEYVLKLPERPEPKVLCLKIGTACVGIIAVYQTFFVLPEWHELITKPVIEAGGSSTGIIAALVAYTLSQLAHGLTYFMLLGTSGAVATGIMQSLRAVCVFVISSLLYCSRQESQCFDTKRGVATLVVVTGVMYYSWAKSQLKQNPQKVGREARKPFKKISSDKNYVV